MIANVILGVRKYKSIENERQILASILKNINLNFDFIDNIEYDAVYKKDRWQLKRYYSFEYFDYAFKENPEPNYLNQNSLKIFIENSHFIKFQGPDSYFNQWWSLNDLKNKKTSEGWRRILREIGINYGLSEIIYTTEWGCYNIDELREDDPPFEELYYKFINNGNRKTEFYGLGSHEHFIEKINPVANKEII